MLRKFITAAVIAAFETVLTLNQWDGLIKTILAAVVFWWMSLLLLIGMEEDRDADRKSAQRAAKASERKRRAAQGH